LVIVGAAAGPLLPRYDIDTADEEALVSFINMLGGTPDSVLENRGLRSLYLPGVKNDIDTLATYVADPEPVGSFGIVALGGRTDPIVDAASIAHWRRITSCEFHMQIVDGGHFFYNDNPQQFFGIINDFTKSAFEK
jgi:surfactin synthase thioesterase subunit